LTHIFHNFVGKMLTESLIIWWETWSICWFSVGWVLSSSSILLQITYSLENLFW